MEDGEGGDPGGADQVQQSEAGPDVEVVGRFVQDEQARALDERPCQQDALVLDAGQ